MSSLFSVNIVDEQSQTNNHFLSTHKASFRSEFCIENKETFLRQKKALLFVSVGQAYHEDGKFLATIELLNKYDFESCDIVMADTLQRHNFKGAMGITKAYEYSKKAGDRWLERNRFALEQYRIKHRIIRWDELLNHPDYAGYRKLIDEEYERNTEYQEALHVNSSAYLERLSAINSKVSAKELLANGLEYLIEEMPIVMPMWADMGYEAIIYPKPLTVGMRKTYELFVKNSQPNKCQWLFMRFKKNKNPIAIPLHQAAETEIRVS